MPWEANIETILRTGQIVGNHYRVEGLIATGGMAAVWAGVNENTGKRVALKVILKSFASNGEASELFRREALTASKINHPNVVNIFDVIDHEGMTCIVMELLEGETLGTYLARNGPLSLKKTVAVLLPAMRGVAAAHAEGVIHRDLKPGNIFMCSGPDGHLLTTKVLDFGISVRMNPVSDVAPATDHLGLLGTPAYMAPEAITASANIDGRADVYGFGVLFFETLTGKVPFVGPVGGDLLRRILAEPAPLVTLYRPDLPASVVNLVACALAKRPQDRFATMNDLIHATENRLLPLSTPGSLPSMSDVYSLPVVDVATNTPIVKDAFVVEPSNRIHSTATKAIYSMAGQSLLAASGTGFVLNKKLLSAAARPQSLRKSLSPARSRRSSSRRVAMGVALVAFVIVIAWVSAPKSSNGGGKGRSWEASRRAQTEFRPVVIPLPSTSRPASPPAVVVTNVEEVRNINAASIRAARRSSVRHVSRAKATPTLERLTVESPLQAKEPAQQDEPLRVNSPRHSRAGSLLLSDF